MVEFLVPADAEVAVLTELSTVLPTLGKQLTTAAGTVGTKIPTRDPKPAEFIRVVATGGPGRDLVTGKHVLALEGYAKREQDARDLCALAVAVVEAAARAGVLGSVPCYAASASMPANLPHPDVPTHFRFTSTISVDLRKATV